MNYINIKESPEKVSEGLTMSGSEVGEIESPGGDTVMDLEITSNRPDCLNVIGLAREVSAVFDKRRERKRQNRSRSEQRDETECGLEQIRKRGCHACIRCS